MKSIGAWVVVLAVVTGSAGAQLRDPLTVRSPRGGVELKLLAGEPRLRFAVSVNGATVVEPSPITFTVDGVDLTNGAAAVRHDNYAINEQYPTHGAHAQAVNYANGLRQTLKHPASGQEFTIDLRAYGDGVAFRLIVPGAEGAARVPEETTTFTLPAGTTVWSHNLRGHYEGTYEKREIGAVEAGTWHAPPVTFKLPGGTYAAITEAALVNYSGMALEADGNRGFRLGLAHRQPVSHPYALRYTKEDIERLSKPAAVTGTITTPWRVVMLAGDLNQLVNSDLITNLNPPPDPKLFPTGAATPWVLPGRAVWRYLDNEVAPRGDAAATRPNGPTTRPARGASPLQRAGGEGVDVVAPARATPLTDAARVEAPRIENPPAEAGSPSHATTTTTRATATTTTSTSPASRPRVTALEMQEWSELAGKLGFEYSILEGFWRHWTPEELKELTDASRVQGVGIWVWVHSRDLRTAEQRKAVFERCLAAGVVGLKVDFFDHEHKETIDQYHAILKDAAGHKLLLNFHGANKPTGGSRTWPNELVREAVRGMESRLAERAVHHTTLPFTRFPAGPAEYTPVMFDTLRRGDTTFAHQVATPIVFAAPLLTYAAHPKALLPSPAADVIREVPPVWDETIVLPPSEIGEVAVFARRSGERWFLAVLNGPPSRQMKVPLTFLRAGKFTATFVRDGKSPETMKVETDQPATAKDAITIDLPPGGGFVGVFTPKED